jgi:hypothetical protein
VVTALGLRVGPYEVYGRLRSTNAHGRRTYDVFVKPAPDQRVPYELESIGRVYRAAGDGMVVGHWRNSRQNTGYRTKWVAMQELALDWLVARRLQEASDS